MDPVLDVRVRECDTIQTVLQLKPSYNRNRLTGEPSGRWGRPGLDVCVRGSIMDPVLDVCVREPIMDPVC